MNNEDVSKTLRQEESIQKWRKSGGNGTLLLCPRFGKTKIGCDIALRTVSKNNNSCVLIICPSDYIKQYWNKNINHPNVYTETINTIIDRYNKQHQLLTYDLVIVDEVHKCLSEVRYDILTKLRLSAHWWINLLGIEPHEKEKDMISSLAPIIDRITPKEAIEKKWIAPSIEYNFRLDLSEEDKIRYIKYSNYMFETLDLFKGIHNKVLYNNQKLFESDFDVVYACFTGKKIPHGFVEGSKFRDMVADVMGWSRDLDLDTEYGSQRNVYWNPNAIYDRCKAFTRIVRERNNILTDNDVKLNAVLDIIKHNPVPSIIFNESIDFVVKIADALGKDAIAYHSRIESRPIWDDKMEDWIRYKTGAKQGEPKKFSKDFIKTEFLEGIILGKYKYLICAKALDEGVTIPNLEQVIITAGSTNPIQQGQRSARGCTIDINNPNKQTKIINLYFDDIHLESGKIIKSRDKAKLLERQTENVIDIISLDEISL